MVLFASSPKTLELQVHRIISSFLHWFGGSNSGSYTCLSSSLSTMPSPQAIFIITNNQDEFPYVQITDISNYTCPSKSIVTALVCRIKMVHLPATSIKILRHFLCLRKTVIYYNVECKFSLLCGYKEIQNMQCTASDNATRPLRLLPFASGEACKTHCPSLCHKWPL